MKRISFLAAAAAATLGSVVGANATVVGFSSFGGIYGIGGVPPGETVDTNFSSGLPLGATGDGSIYTPSGAMSQAGVEAGSYVAAPYTSTGSSTGKFFRSIMGRLKPLHSPSRSTSSPSTLARWTPTMSSHSSRLPGARPGTARSSMRILVARWRLLALRPSPARI